MSFSHILVATDGSELATKGVRIAAELAKALGARLTGIHASSAAKVPSDMSFIAEARLKDGADTTPDRAADEIAREAVEYANKLGVQCTMIQESGPAGDTIVRVASEQGCDLVVMGTHGRQGMGALLMGSVAQQVIAHSAMPVLTVR